ncbi:GFS12 [Scenedesmus sp. PABB004]|nr:GFS12 [Scenedesmus sp. PABB004]
MAAAVPAMAQQLRSLCAGVGSLCGPGVAPQALTPHIHPPGSGAAVCQLDADGESSAGAGDGDDGTQQRPPELAQLLSANQQLLVTLLLDDWREQQQQQELQQQRQQQQPQVQPQVEQQAEQQAQGLAAPDADTAAAAGASGGSDCGRGGGAPGAPAGSRWMHAGLQQFLYELERGPWTGAAAAKAAPAEPQHEPRRAAAGAALPPAPGSDWLDRGGGLLDWLRAAHPAAALAVDGAVVGRARPGASEAGSGGGEPEGAARFLARCGAGRSAHPNLQPVLLLATRSTDAGAGDGARCAVVSPHVAADARSLLRFAPASLGGDWHLRFLLHQLLSALASLHAQGLALGGLSSEQLALVAPGWLQLLATPAGALAPRGGAAPGAAPGGRRPAAALALVREPGYSLSQLTELWRRRGISNFEYLLWLNAAAGRCWGDRRRHPLVPWVIDFSARPDLDARAGAGGAPPPGWRDLGFSQYRRAKGDAQLDQTYAMSGAAAAAAADAAGEPAAAGAASASWDPWAPPRGWGGAAAGAAPAPAPVQAHHVSNEPLSELSFAIYAARRLPVALLVRLVRRSFRPAEYPSSLEALYLSSPDEALPQFYCDPRVFVSRHAGMTDLAVPAWAGGPDAFVALHRAALESEYVSANLHKWIDLTFGVALSGAAGLAAKNIHLPAGAGAGAGGGAGAGAANAAAAGGGAAAEPPTHGVWQLFVAPHPPRATAGDGGQQQLRPAPVGGGGAEGAGDFLQPEAEVPPPPTPGQLALCWSELSSLEAAAAAGCWSPERTAAPSAAAGAAAQQASSGGAAAAPAPACKPLPAFAADLAAVGVIAVQLYRGLQAPGEDLALGRAAGAQAAERALAGAAGGARALAGLGAPRVPAAASLFARQCAAGQLSAQGLLRSAFFPPWMEAARDFMLRLLFARHAPGDAGGAGDGGAASWSVRGNAFAALAELAAPGGALQQLAATPEALQLCLPAVLHVARGGLLGGAAQQGGERRSGADVVDAACVVVLRLAAVLPPLQLQRHLVPLLADVLAVEQRGAEQPGAAVGGDALPSGGDEGAGQQRDGEQGAGVLSAAARAAAGRRAALQPVLWQLLSVKLPQAALVSALLPPLLAAVLEPQADGLLAPGTTAAAGSPEEQLLLLRHQHASAADGPGDVGSRRGGVLALLPRGAQAAAAEQGPAVAAAAGRPRARRHQDQEIQLPLQHHGHLPHAEAQQSHAPQAQLGAGCLAVLAQALPFPVALLALAAVLPRQLAAEYVFAPALKLALAPLAAHGGSGGSADPAPRVAQHTLAALPVLEGLLGEVLPALAPAALLPPGKAAPTAPAPSAAGPAPASAGAAGAAGVAAPPGDGAGSAGSGAQAPAGAAAPPPLPPQQQQPAGGAGECRLHQVAELWLAPPDAAAVADCPLLYPRLAALLLVSLEAAATSGAGRSHAKLLGGWLLPQVLQPLLSPDAAEAWQAGGAAQRRCYHRVVLLLYAATARELGLRRVREALPAWHSIEVWLSAETGWEPQQGAQQLPGALPAGPLSGGSKAAPPAPEPHPLQLLAVLAEQERAATAVAIAAAAAAAGEPAAPAAAADGGRGGSRVGDAWPLPGKAGAAPAGWEPPAAIVGAARSRSAGSEPDGGGAPGPDASSLSGRVSDLLQRIAEEKVARRSLSTTHEFLEGVGWSMPRPVSASAALGGGAGTPGTAEAAPQQQEEQQRQQQQQEQQQQQQQQQQEQQEQLQHMRRALSAPLAAEPPDGALAAAARPAPGSGDGGGAQPLAAATANGSAAHAASNGGPPPHVQLEHATSAEGGKAPASVAAAARAPDASPRSPGRRADSPPPQAAGRSWAAELSELRLLLDSPARTADRGPSAGREWFWLLQNPQLDPHHLLPPDPAAAAGAGRPWRSVAGAWWEEGWSLGAVALHAWPAHRERLRALAVDPGERWVATAGRGVVRVWELADAETKVQYAGHRGAGVARLAFVGCGSGAVASLDVTGSIHVWSRATGTQLTCFVPSDVSEPAAAAAPSWRAAADLTAAGDAPGAGGAQQPSSSGPAAEPSGAGSSAAAAAAALQPLALAGGGGFLDRGCSSSRGWQALAALPSSRQLTAAGGPDKAAAGGRDGADAAAAAGAADGVGSVLGAGPAALALGGLHRGYTTLAAVGPGGAFCDRLGALGTASAAPGAAAGAAGLAAASDAPGSAGLLLAGTADGHVCCLDLDCGALVDDMVAAWEPGRPAAAWVGHTAAPGGWDDPTACVISAVATGGDAGGAPGPWLAAGSGSGRVALLDARAGAALAGWQAHGGGGVGQLSGLRGVQLLSCGHDRLLKLWDLRMLRAAPPAAHGGVSPLAVFAGSRADGIEGFAVYQDAALVHGGAGLGLAPLAGGAPPPPAGGATAAPGWSSAAPPARQVRMTGVRGGAARGGGGLSGAPGGGAPGGGKASAIVGLGLLPHSKLLVVGSEDGQVKVCR